MCVCVLLIAKLLTLQSKLPGSSIVHCLCYNECPLPFLSDNIPVMKKPPKLVLDSLKAAGNALPTRKKATPTKQVAPPTKKMATPIIQQEVIRKKASSKSKVVLSKSPSPPRAEVPPPPPPPPPPLISRPHPHPSYQRSRSVTSQRRVMLEQVRTSGRKVASKLRPVVTIEKRAFRVGEY